MTRTSDDVYINGILHDGYDYTNQAWVRRGLYVQCGHPKTMDCFCYGRAHAGESCTVQKGFLLTPTSTCSASSQTSSA